MSIIFIPSKKIYNIDHSKISNNLVTKVEQSYNKITKAFGNVLSQEYLLTFFEDNPNVDLTTAQPYQIPAYNYGFQFDLSTESGVSKLTSIIALPVSKLTQFVFGTNADGETILTSHQLKSIRRMASQITVDNVRTFREKGELKEPIIYRYDSLGKIIYLKYSVIAQENDEITYSDTISLVGNYIIPEEQTQIIGEGNHAISIPSNEIIQGENTNLSKFANDILANYGKGKETATVLCSIGEYADENGELVISTKTANKMMFEHYDQVVPMVRNAWGTDSPLSLNSSGLAKVFEVVGVRIYADGAIWQELTMREVGEVAVQVQLPPPQLSLNGSVITITDISGVAEEYDLFVNGVLTKTMAKVDEYDVADLNLGYGSYEITMVARANGYIDSAKSHGVKFVLVKQLYTTYYTEVNSANGLSYLISSNDYTVTNGTYIIGENS